MRKMFSLVLFSFCGTMVYAQQATDKDGEQKDGLFGEALRMEIIGGIKQKMSSDTSFQKSQQNFNEYFKACGLHMQVKKTEQPAPAKAFVVAPESIALISRKNK